MVWYKKALSALAHFLMDAVAKNMRIDQAAVAGFEDTLSMLREFLWPSHVPPLPAAGKAEAIAQAADLLHVASVFVPLPDTIFAKDFEIVHLLFRNFTMHPGWAGVCVNGGDEDEAVLKFATEFSEAMCRGLYSDEVKKKAFNVTVAEQHMLEQLDAFKASVPPEYQTSAVPGAFADLKTQGLVFSAGIAGDTQLAEQIRFIMAAHSLLRAIASLAEIRGRAIGSAGGKTAIDDATVVCLNVAQESFQHAKAVFAAKGVESIFKNSSNPLHLTALDGFVEPDAMSTWVAGLATKELGLLREGWELQLRSAIDSISKGIIPGWEMHVPVLLEESSATMRAAMLSNANFQALSKMVVHTANLSVVIKKVADPFLDPHLLNTLSKATCEGTQLVSITYALFKLTKQIPSSAKKAEEVKSLRDDMKQRRVAMGASLEAEAARLEAL